MNHLYNYIIGDNVANYVEVGFSQQEAKAMSWIAQQKPKGKFYGLCVGSFIAFGWGHWHDRIMSYFRFHWHKRFTQLAIVGAAVTFGDHLFSGRRHGADQYLANALFLNNNLFKANLDSLIQNFNILNRRFTPQQITYFNERAVAVKSNIDLKDRKWIYNPIMYTEEEFARRVKLFTNGPWTDRHISNNIKFHNMDRGKLQLAPTKLHTLIDETGDKLGITKDFTFGWTPLK